MVRTRRFRPTRAERLQVVVAALRATLSGAVSALVTWLLNHLG